MLIDMPYALADDWFEEKLNSVSISYQRQRMPRTKDTRSTSAGAKSSPQTRSASRLREEGAVPSTSHEASGVSSTKRKRKDKKKQETQSGGDGRSSSSATTVDLTDLANIDIPSIILDVVNRVANKERVEDIKRSMPTYHRAWSTVNIHRHARAINQTLTEEHYQAFGVAAPSALMTEEMDLLDDQDDVLPSGQRTPLIIAPSSPRVTKKTETTPSASTHPTATVSVPPPPQFSVVEIDGKLCLRDGQGNVQELPPLSFPNLSVTTSNSTPTTATTTTTTMFAGAVGLVPAPPAVTASTSVGEVTEVRRSRMTVPDIYAAPVDITLPLRHPEPASYLTEDEAAGVNAWKKVWRDHLQFETLSSRDAQAIVRVSGACHYFGREKKGGITVSGACGHISKGVDFHWLCRVCQFLATRRICCTRLTNMCDVGDKFKKVDGASYELARNFRFNFMAGIRDRGFAAKVEWLGDSLELRFSAVGRLAYAVGVGASGLEASLARLERNQAVLEIENFHLTVARWRNYGVSQAPVSVSPRTSYRITPVYLKANAALRRWQDKEKSGTADVIDASLTTSPDAATSDSKPTRRRRASSFFLEASDKSEASAGAGHKRSAEKMDVASYASGSKAARSETGSRMLARERRTPTPVGLHSGELNVIDGVLVLRLPLSDAGVYRGRSTLSRLHLQSNNWLVEDALRRLSTVTYDAELARLAKASVLPVHQEVRTFMEIGDRRRMEELEEVPEIPVTATWPLQANTSFVFDELRNDFRPGPTRHPSRHLEGTPDHVETDTCLPTAYSSLCAMEELGRVSVLNSSLLLHMLDEAESTSSVTESYNWSELFIRLRGAARRLATCAVDVQQTATYHRRWSLLQGAEVVDAKPLLQAPSGMGVLSILNVPLKEDATERATAAERSSAKTSARAPAVSSEEDDQDGRNKTYLDGGPSTPVKLTVSDVESVLGVLKTVINTPQSTSSISSIVNRVSGRFASEIMSEFQNLGGGGDASLGSLENLNIS